jgi:hypothetical protein
MGFANKTKLHNVENVVNVIIIVKSYVFHIKTLSCISCHFTFWSTQILHWHIVLWFLHRFYWNFLMKLKINNLKVVQNSRIITKKKFKAYIRVTLINVLSMNPIQLNNSQLVTQGNFLFTCRPMNFIYKCFIIAWCNVECIITQWTFWPIPDEKIRHMWHCHTSWIK